MSREIKFRAWDQELKKMFVPNHIDGYGTLVTEERHENGDGTWGTHPIEYPRDYVLMQYTGLKDKNGKDCYEKDKLRSWEGIEWQIEWNDEKACFELHWKGGPQPEYYRLPMSSIKDMKCELIGNEYEN